MGELTLHSCPWDQADSTSLFSSCPCPVQLSSLPLSPERLPRLITCTWNLISTVLPVNLTEDTTSPRETFPSFFPQYFLWLTCDSGPIIQLLSTFLGFNQQVIAENISDMILTPGRWMARTNRLQNGWSELGRRGLIRAWLRYGTWPLLSIKPGKLMISYLLVNLSVAGVQYSTSYDITIVMWWSIGLSLLGTRQDCLSLPFEARCGPLTWFGRWNVSGTLYTRPVQKPGYPFLSCFPLIWWLATLEVAAALLARIPD